MNEVFSIRLKQLRKENKKTQDDIAKYLNITRATVSAYERNLIMPSFDNLKALSSYFNVSTDYLAGTTNTRGTSVESCNVSAILDKLVNTLENQNTVVKCGDHTLTELERTILSFSLQSSLDIAKKFEKGIAYADL